MNRSDDPYRDFYRSSAEDRDLSSHRRRDPRFRRENTNKNKRKHSAVQIGRALIQLAAFLVIPGLFISVFSAIGAIYTAVIGGTFIFAEQLPNILLVSATLILTALWGRFFCGFLCSFGAMQDLFRFLGKRITKKNLVPEKADRVLKYLKYAVLLFIMIGVWTLGVGTGTVWSPWTVFGAYVSPFSGFPTELIFLSVGGAFLLLTIIGSMFIDRFFCRYLCPLGAIFTLISRFRVFKVKKPSAACGGCRGCTKSCPMAIPLYKYNEITSGECIDCMKCTGACRRENVRIETLPAVSGTVAAIALAGVTFAGTLNTDGMPSVRTASSAPDSVASTEAVDKFKDGTYAGAAAGYRGAMSVSVTVENGNISDVTVVSSRDDREFLSKAQNGVIPAILSAQDTDVETVSGATFSSRGIINAVEDALGSQLTAAREITSPATEAATEALQTEVPETEVEKNIEPETDAPEADEAEPDTDEESFADTPQGSFTDGVYSGSGSGFRGTTSVSVTVENGTITDITVLSYQDDDRFFQQAQYGVIANILSSQSIDVDTVSGATFSSNSIIEAVANALGLNFSNPNGSMGSMGGGHGRH